MSLRVIDPLEYFRAHLKRGVRPDGRGLMRGRRPAAHRAPLAAADGSLLVRMGRTAVIAGVSCEPTTPSEAEPARGRIVVSLEFPAVCSPAAAASALHGGGGGGGGGGRIERDKAALVELLQRTANGGLVDLDALCGVEGTAVWSCYCDLYVLEHDGNVADVAMLAMMGALASVVLPRIAVDEASGGLTVVEEDTVRVEIAHPVFPCSFGLLDGELILDPSAEEEALLASTFTLLLDGTGELRALHKPGGAPLPDGSLTRCVQAAQKRVPALAAALTSPAAAPCQPVVARLE